MADNSTWSREQTSRVRDFYNVYTRGFSAEAFQRLFTRDTRDAYRYFSNAVDREALAVLPWWKRPIVFARGLFLALTMKMSPARRVLFAVALGAAAVGVVMMLEGFHVVWIPIDPLVLSRKGSLFLTRPSLVHYISDRASLEARAADVLGDAAAGRLKVRIDRIYPLAEAAEAHRALEGRQTTGKVLLVP